MYELISTDNDYHYHNDLKYKSASSELSILFLLEVA